MDNSFNEEIGRKFLVKRLKKEYRKYGLKQNLGKKQTLDLPDAESTEKYLWSFIKAIKEGIGDSVPQDCIKNVVEQVTNIDNVIMSGFVDLLSEEAYKKFKVKIACSFALRIRDGVVELCCITFHEIQFVNPMRMKNLLCENPELIGKVMAEIYKTSEEDLKKCEIEIIKANKLKQMTFEGLCAILHSLNKEKGLGYHIIELDRGVFRIKVTILSNLFLIVYVDSMKFDNDFMKLRNAVDLIDDIICKRQTGQTFPDKQKGVVWTFTNE